MHADTTGTDDPRAVLRRVFGYPSFRGQQERVIARVLEGVSFSLGRGRTLGLVGESGCGKSMTALAIMRLIPDPPGRITAGHVRFEGTDLLRLDDAAIGPAH